MAFFGHVKEPNIGVKGTDINLWGPSHNLCGPRYYLVSGLSVCTCHTCLSDCGESLSLRAQPLYELYEK